MCPDCSPEISVKQISSIPPLPCVPSRALTRVKSNTCQPLFSPNFLHRVLHIITHPRRTIDLERMTALLRSEDPNNLSHHNVFFTRRDRITSWPTCATMQHFPDKPKRINQTSLQSEINILAPSPPTRKHHFSKCATLELPRPRF